MSFTLCSSEAIIAKAGLNVNSTIAASGAIIAQWCDQAEAWVNAETREDWVTNYSSVGTEFRDVLADVVSSKAAINMITYDLSGYTSRSEAQTMLDVNRDIIRLAIGFLKEEKTKTKMGV